MFKKMRFTKERIIGISIVCSTILYLILTQIATSFYPTDYIFDKHTFSYLGKTEVNGKDNTIARTLLIIACLIVAITLVPFFIVLPKIFMKTDETKITTILSSISGIIASPFLLLIALIPMNTHPQEHQFVADLFFMCVASAILFTANSIFFDENYKNIFGIIFMILGIVTIAYVFRAFDLIRPIMQKFLVYSFIIFVFIQVIKLWKLAPEKKKSKIKF